MSHFLADERHQWFCTLDKSMSGLKRFLINPAWPVEELAEAPKKLRQLSSSWKCAQRCGVTRKEVMGSDQYQPHSADAIIRFWALRLRF